MWCVCSHPLLVKPEPPTPKLPTTNFKLSRTFGAPYHYSPSRFSTLAHRIASLLPPKDKTKPPVKQPNSFATPTARGHDARLLDRRQGRRRRHGPPDSRQATREFRRRPCEPVAWHQSPSLQAASIAFTADNSPRSNFLPSCSHPTFPLAPSSTSRSAATYLPSRPPRNASRLCKTRSTMPLAPRSPRPQSCDVATLPRPRLSSSGTPFSLPPPT